MNKKKRRLKKKVKVLLTIFVISLIGAIYYLYYNSPSNYLKNVLGYKKETVEVFKDKNIVEEVKNNNYSKTLEECITNNNFNIDYLNEYLKIVYKDNNDFIVNINKLLDKKYNSNDINIFYKKLNDTSIELILNKEYIKDLNKYIEINYFKEENLERYLDYKKESKSIEEIITFVNIGLDNEFYTNTKKIENPNDLLVLVNKYNYLDENFVPSDLEIVNSKYSVGEKKLKKEARVNFENMCEDALKEGIILKAGSTYRSYSYQNNLYNNYVKKDGKKAADTYSARAGFSEHQTGLAIDIMNDKEYIDEMVTKKEYNWLINNSYKYGYVLRYPKDKENITGYMFEDWHFRYFGEKLATELYKNNLTYEEYLAKK